MVAFLLKVGVNAVAIWIASLVISGITVGGGPDEGVPEQVLTFVVLGLVFGLLNAVVKPVVKVLAFPLYVVTLGLFTFIVNALMLQLTSWIADATPLTFSIDDFFWTAVFGALVVSLVSLALNLVLPDGKDD